MLLGVIVQRIKVDEKLSNIVAAVEGINQRLGDLEARTGSTGDSGPVSFADVVRRTISEVRGSEEPGHESEGSWADEGNQERGGLGFETKLP